VHTGHRTALVWVVFAGVMLATPILRCVRADDTHATDDDRLVKLAQQLSGPTTQSPEETATAAPPGEISPNERRPLTRGTSDVDEVSPPLPTPKWGGGWVLNTVTALGAVLLVIFGLRALLTRIGVATGGGARHPAVEVLSRTMIAPRNHVLLMRVANRILVVGDSPAGLRTLAQIDDPAEIAGLLAATTAASPHSISRGFSQMLGRYNRDFDDSHRIADEGNDQGEHTIDRTRDRVTGLLSRLRSLSTKEASSS
jgi:flagellar biogenesis protein FliO